MKLSTLNRAAAALLAVGMTAALAGCGSTASTDATPESAATDESGAAATEDAYAYLADFRFDSIFDENGYVTGITASDYVTLADGYDEIAIPASLGVVTPEDITSYINDNVLSSYTTTAQITDRAAADGDTVHIDYVGSVDGVEFDGGSTGGAGANLTLGSGQYIDGFEEQIVGHTPGEEAFDINVTFPENYGSADLAGKDAVFTITLHYIAEEQTPELSDAWVAENLQPNMGLTDVASLNAFVEDTMLFDNQSNSVYSALLEKATFADEMPETVVNYYRDSVLNNLYLYAQQYGMTTEEFVQAQGMEGVDAYMTQMAPSLESAIHQQMLMQAVAEAKGIVCDTDTLNAEFHRFFGANDPTQFNEYYGENYVKMNMLHNIVMQDLIDNVTYTAETPETAQAQ